MQRIREVLAKLSGNGSNKQDSIIVVPNHSMERESTQWKKQHRLQNGVKTTKYTLWNFIPKNLFIQFHRFANFWFAFFVILNWIPQLEVFAKEVSCIPLVFVLSITMIKDAVEDFRRYRADRKNNALSCRRWNCVNSRYTKEEWKEITVGDFVRVSCNQAVPADLLFVHSADLSGICYVETSNLDGESNLKQRRIVESSADQLEHVSMFLPTHFKSVLTCAPPDNQIYKFSGILYDPDTGSKGVVSANNLLLRGCILRNTDFIEGLVVYTGHDTKAMKNIVAARNKVSKLDSQMNWDILWCLLVLLVLCITCGTGSALWTKSHSQKKIPFVYGLENVNIVLLAFRSFWQKSIVFQTLIPVTIFVTLELVKMCHIYFISEDLEMIQNKPEEEGSSKKIECRTFNISEDLGQIQYVMSDKTGTLTENIMIFRRCTVAGVDYEHPSMMGHVLVKSIQGNGDENPVHPTLKKLTDSMVGMLDCSSLNVRLIFDFMFNMAVCNTVVVNQRPHRDIMDQVVIVTDGAAAEGTRNVLNQEEFNKWLEMRKEAEVSMDDDLLRESADQIGIIHKLRDTCKQFLGVTGIEDRLQDGVPECIACLRKAGIKVWVLTGDKVETAVNIGYSCRLFSPAMDLIHLTATSDIEADEMLTTTLKQVPHEMSSTVKKSQRKEIAVESKLKKNKFGLVLDGTTLTYCIGNHKFLMLARRCHAVLFCRATPIQKADVVKLIKKTGARTLAIGVIFKSRDTI